MSSETTETIEEPRYESKRRNCLMCGDGFDSEWAGERVCKRCKSNDGWRNGNAVHAA